MSLRHGLLFLAGFWAAAGAAAPSGSDLMADALRRYAPPPVSYEEQALVMTDRQGNRTVRTLRTYCQRDAQGSRSLRVVETPLEARGSSLYVELDSQGHPRPGAALTAAVFGSNLTVMDLESEPSGDFRYEREADQVLERVQHYVLRAQPADETAAQRSGYRERRLYLRQDNLYLSRIDYLDGAGQLQRRAVFRAPAPDDTGAWRPRMVLMEDLRLGERTLLKIERRIHSADYVPASVFPGVRKTP